MKAVLILGLLLLVCAGAGAQDAGSLLADAQRHFDAREFVQADSFAGLALARFPDGCTAEKKDALLLAASCAQAVQDDARALPWLGEALNCFQELQPGGASGEAAIWLQLGRCRQRLGQYDEAISAYESGLAVQLRFLPAGHPDFSQTYFFLGWAHLSRSTYNDAIDWLEKASGAYLAGHGERSVEYANVLEKLTQAYLYNGRYTDALANAQKLLALRQQLHPPNHPAIAKACVIVGTQYKYLKKYASALQYFNNAQDIYQQAEKKNFNAIAECYSEVGQIYLYQKNYPKALATFQLEDAAMISGGEQLKYDYAYTCIDLGKYYLAMGDYPQALAWEKKAMDIALAHSRSDNANLATFYLYLGRAQAAMGQFPEAIASFQSNADMLQRLYGDLSPRQYHNNAELGFAYLRWYRRNQETPLLEKSRHYFRQFETDIDRLMQTEILPEAQQKLRSESLVYCERAIQAELAVLNLHPNDSAAMENAWQLSEKMHSYMLLAATMESQVRHFAGIPDSMLEKDRDLQTRIVVLEKKRQRLAQQQRLATADSLLVALDVQIAQLKAGQTRLWRSFETNYPEYYRLKYQTRPASLSQLQQSLKDGQTLLEYFTGDSILYVFELSKNNCRIHRLPVQSDLRNLTEACLRGITAYHTAAVKSPDLYRSSVLQYAEAAQRLYEQLWRPLGSRLPQDLIVVPGEYLAALPFEVLLSGAPTDPALFSTYPFLLKKHRFQYAYSATMWLEMQKPRYRERPPNDLLAMAPFCTEQSALPDQSSRQDLPFSQNWKALPYSDEEVMAVAARFGGPSKIVLGAEASRDLFARLAPQYRILHLATHGKADTDAGDRCYLAFSTGAGDPDAGWFSAAELYNLQLHADLVTLSACETGMGEQLRGEGVLSLARAFAYAGAGSIVASLWSVNDQSTRYIMDDFYAGLKDGKTRPAALEDAKRAYLEKHPGREAHPFFWAAFVGLGDASPIAR